MSSIVVSGDTSGAVTLSAPAVAGTVTVTLPSTSGVMAVGGGTITTLTTTSDITVQGVTVGRGAGAAPTNTAVGADALSNGSQSGARNTSLGYRASYLNTSGENITALGAYAIYSNTTGTDHVGVGYGALDSNTSGSYNTALGNNALGANTTASNNTAVGYQAGYTNVTGASNVYVGTQAGKDATSNSNVFVGKDAGLTVSSGGGNTYVGFGSGPNVTAGTGTFNTTLGYLSGNAITTGSKNTIIGSYTGSAAPISETGSNYIVLSDGDGNVRGTFDASGNFLVGQTSGSYKLSVTGTVYLDSRVSTGYGSPAAATLGVFGSSNDDAVNSGAVYNMEWRISGNAGGQYWYSNYLTRGGSRTLGAYCTGTAWTNASDIVNKEDIVSIGYGLETVMASNPVDFRWKTMKDEDGLGKKDIGFIAQEMELIVPEVVTGDDGQKGISYGNLVAVAFRAIQEQQTLITQLTARITALEGASA